MARPHGDPLPLPSGELPRAPVEQFRNAQDIRGPPNLVPDLRLRDLAQPQAERHVLLDRHVRVQRVVLEHHRDVPVLRGHIVHAFVADPDIAGGDILEAGDHAEHGALATAGRADQDHELVVGDAQVNPPYGFHRVKGLDQILEGHVCHRDQPLVAPEVRPAM